MSEIDNNNIELELDTTEDEATTEDKGKVTETPEAKKARLERQLAQVNKKLGIKPEAKVEKNVDETESNNKGGLDKVDRMILRSEGIKSADEIALVEEFMKVKGQDIDTILESRVFKAELKALRDEAKAEDAIPSNSKRSTNSNRNSVEYWLAKGEMPPANEPQLRRDYVNAKITKTKERTMFSDTPIA